MAMLYWECPYCGMKHHKSIGEDCEFIFWCSSDDCDENGCGCDGKHVVVAKVTATATTHKIDGMHGEPFDPSCLQGDQS